MLPGSKRLGLLDLPLEFQQRGVRREARAPVVRDVVAICDAESSALHQLAKLDDNVSSFCTTLIETAEWAAATPEHPLSQKLDATARTRWLAAIRGAFSGYIRRVR